MKEISIEHLAYHLKRAKEKKLQQPIFFLGAGASCTGNIPLAAQIVTDILTEHADNPAIRDLPEEKRDYARLMGCLLAHERNELLRGYIDNARINVTHIYLAQLLKEGYADYILTVNFDNLMLRALALYNIFPPTYDMAIIKDTTTSTILEKSVVYLHGQSHGLWLLNTEEEMNKIKSFVPRIIDPIKNGRPWVFIGYSGGDPIFDYVKSLGRFDNGLYWVTYYETDPNENVCKFLNTPNTNASIIRGYDSDSFMLKLNSELELSQPDILDKPFTTLEKMLGNIVDIDDKEHFKGVKERMSIARRQVKEAINKYEEVEIKQPEKEKDDPQIDLLKKEIIGIIITEKYEEAVIFDIQQRVNEFADNTLNNLLANLYFNWGNDLCNLANLKSGDDREDLYKSAIGKYEKSISLKPDDPYVYNNWGSALSDLAGVTSDGHREDLYKSAIEKYEKSISLKPDNPEAYNNCGSALSKLAGVTSDGHREDLYRSAIEKYEKSISLNPDDPYVYYNWGNALSDLAGITSDGHREDFYRSAIEKYEKSISLKPDNPEAYNNCGSALSDLADLTSDEHSEDFYQSAIEKYEKSISLKPDNPEAYCNWGNALYKLAGVTSDGHREDFYQSAIEKYEKSISLNPDDPDVYNNWGSVLADLAGVTSDGHREDFYKSAIEKYEKSISLNPDNPKAYNNWGSALSDLAGVTSDGHHENFYQSAIEKYEKSISLKPNNPEAYYNWGSALSDLAGVTSDGHREDLYKSAIEKYEKSISLNPHYPGAYDNLGVVLMNLAQLKEGDEKERLFREAIEKFERNIEYGGGVYNLSCLYAIKRDKEQALKYLDIALKNKEITTQYVKEDDDWKEFLTDNDFMELIRKYEDEQEKGSS